MTLTSFGLLYLPALVALFLFRRHGLLPFLVVSSVFQSPSVLNLRLGDSGVSYGLTPFNLASLFVLFDLARIVIVEKKLDLGTGKGRVLLQLWFYYAAIAVVGAFVLPWLFAGTPVYPLLNKQSFEFGIAPLHGSLSNLAQAINLLVLIAIMIYIRVKRADLLLPRRLMGGFALALGMSALVGLQQRLAWNDLVPMMESFWASNPTYAQNYISHAGQIPRVSWPFIEPAYSSAWYAALFGGCFTLFLSGRKTQQALLGTLLAGFAVLNSLGATGILAIGLFALFSTGILCYVWIGVPEQRWGLGYRVTLGAIAFSCSALAIFLVLRHDQLLPSAVVSLNNLFSGQNPTMWGDIRPETNWHAFEVFMDTWGLGAGLGSNRASSYLGSLFSNTGLLGGAIFILALAKLWSAMRPARDIPPSGSGLFFLGAGVCSAIAVGIAIPDQNWPGFWVFILAGLAWVNRCDFSTQNCMPGH